MNTGDILFRRTLDDFPDLARQFQLATPRFLVWLGQHDLPIEIVDHFAAFSILGETNVKIGFGTFYSEHLIRSFHDDTPEYLHTGWLIVGSMPNGDFAVLDLDDDGAVGYVSHEEVWDEPHHVRDDLRSIYIRICDTFGAFLDGLLSNKFPYDYFDARERRSAPASDG